MDISRQTQITASGTSSANENLGPTLAGYGISYAVTSFVSALLVLLKETNESVHGFMQALTGHHWVTHGVFDVLLFVLLGWTLSKMDFAKSVGVNSVITAVVVSTIASSAIIALFFGWSA